MSFFSNRSPKIDNDHKIIAFREKIKKLRREALKGLAKDIFKRHHAIESWRITGTVERTRRSDRIS